MTLAATIEGLLFVSNRPLSLAQIKNATSAKKAEVEKALAELSEKYAIKKKSGIVLLRTGDAYQFMSHPDLAELISGFLKTELSAELTEPALETLTIIAYRGPITKPELEQIRGINCGLILRNLLIRGLIERQEEKKGEFVRYLVTAEFVRYLGLQAAADLPNYQTLSKHETLEAVLEAAREQPEGC